MKTLTRVACLLLVVALFASACGSDDDVTNAATPPEPTPEPTPEPSEEPTEEPTEVPAATEAGERIETFFVGSELVDCIGEAPQKCMQIKRTADGEVEWFYSSIEGFDYVEGTSYELTVAVSDVDDPPADGSSLRYRLVEIIESTVETAAGLDGTTWSLLGFRDGDLFDAVLEGVEIRLAFEGDRVSGSAGCNNYMGTFTTGGDAVSFGALAATKKLCPPAVMEQEDRFLATMATIETAQMTLDGTLVLAPTAGMTLVFGRAT